MPGTTQRHLGRTRRMSEPFTETPREFTCAGEQLLGIHCAPVLDAHDIVVLIVVGGPQYRAQIHLDGFEISKLAVAIAHAAIIEPQ